VPLGAGRAQYRAKKLVSAPRFARAFPSSIDVVPEPGENASMKIRQQILAEHGVLNVAVDLIREGRDEE
jgi:hypothetical protein